MPELGFYIYIYIAARPACPRYAQLTQILIPIVQVVDREEEAAAPLPRPGRVRILEQNMKTTHATVRDAQIFCNRNGRVLKFSDL